MIPQILKSIILLGIVSLTIAYICSEFTSISFSKSLLFATAIQLIFFYFYNSIISYITRLKLEKENLETIQLINTNNVLLECSSCKKTNSIRVDLSDSNEFTCTHCGTDNILNIEFKTITKTTPI